MLVYLKLLFTAFFWGGTFIAGKAVAGNVGPFSTAFLRFVAASFFLLIILRNVEGKFPRISKKKILPLILLGLTGIFSYNVFFFKGLKLIDAGRASIIIANNPVVISLLSACLFKEKLNLIKVVGIITSVTGAMIVISKGNPAQFFTAPPGWGELYIFCCVLSWAAFSLIGKSIMNDMSPLTSISYASVIGAAALFLPACLEGLPRDIFHYTPTDWLNLFYLGFFGTVLGFVWYYQGIKTLGPMKASLFINFVPISAIILAFFILGEPITRSLFIGAVFVSCGVYLTNRKFGTSPSAKPVLRSAEMKF